MKYRIGQVASMMGLSIEGLRKYENAGLIMPTRTEDSQYRQYSYLDFTSLIRTRTYRALDFSIREIVRLTNEASVGESIGILRQKEQALRCELGLAQAKIDLLNELCEDLADIDARLDRVDICENPAFYRMEFSRNGVISEEPRVLEEFRRMMDCAPFAYISSRYKGENVYGGLAIRERYARLLGLCSVCWQQALLFVPLNICAFHACSMAA